jgi:hypothetical protein
MDHHQSQELQRLIDEAAVKPAQPTKPKKKTDPPIEDAPTGKCHPFFQTLHLHLDVHLHHHHQHHVHLKRHLFSFSSFSFLLRIIIIIIHPL